MANVQFVEHGDKLLTADQCVVGVVYINMSSYNTTPRPVMFISGEDVKYTILDDDTGREPEKFRPGIYLDSGQLEGFNRKSGRYKPAGTIECS